VDLSFRYVIYEVCFLLCHVCVLSLKYVECIWMLSVGVYGVYVFFVSCSKVPACLADILQVAVIAFYFINAAMVIFIGVYVFHLKVFL
jgi:hypothetical protein